MFKVREKMGKCILSTCLVDPIRYSVRSEVFPAMLLFQGNFRATSNHLASQSGITECLLSQCIIILGAKINKKEAVVIQFLSL